MSIYGMYLNANVIRIQLEWTRVDNGHLFGVHILFPNCIREFASDILNVINNELFSFSFGKRSDGIQNNATQSVKITQAP